jgi:isopenicillin-N N-acyltransferase like protein
LGHYSAIAEFPRALGLLADFFARDLPAETATVSATKAPITPTQQAAVFVQQALAILNAEPAPGRGHFLHAELAATDNSGQTVEGDVRLAVGTGGRFNLWCKALVVGEIAGGKGGFPWLGSGAHSTVFAGSRSATNLNILSHLAPEHLLRYRMLVGAASAMVLVPELVQRMVAVEKDEAMPDGRGLLITIRGSGETPGSLRLVFAEDGETPIRAEFNVAGTKGMLRIARWQTNAPAADDLFEPPAEWTRQEVLRTDLYRMFSAVLNFAGEMADTGEKRAAGLPGLQVVARDPAGHGLLCRKGDKTILIVEGTPSQMGAAHGALLGDAARQLVDRVLYGVGAADSVMSGEWFPDRLAGIERRILPHLPPRFFEECDALADTAGISRRDVRYANLFPERFHCSGVALRGKATVDGQVLHARVLDYMRDIGLQRSAAVVLFMPRDRHNWMSLGYAGFLGTVTAMNEKGLAIGEMGGRGEGLWDGVPMSFLLRDVMERAGTVEEALSIFRAAPRTCEYYYVISDKSGNMRALHCTPEKVLELKPGEQHPDLPHVPEDVVFISGEDRAKTLSRRLQESYGRIDAARLMEIIKRPVAMKSNLHNAIFAPQTLDMWFADAGRTTPACDEPYARVNLNELVQFYRNQKPVGEPGK